MTAIEGTSPLRAFAINDVIENEAGANRSQGKKDFSDSGAPALGGGRGVPRQPEAQNRKILLT